MDLASPLRSLVPTLDAEALTVLAGTTAPLTGNRLAGLASRGSRAGLMRVLDRLVAHGLVLAEPAGAATLYRLNREHLLCEPLLAALQARRRLLDRLRAELESWATPCLHASVFGSVARGDATTSSDIDLLLVRPVDVDADEPAWQRQVRQLEVAVAAWTGNALAILELTPADLARARDAGEPLLQSLQDDALVLVGPTVPHLLVAAT